ncbi:MAG: ABC transporter substrate-binding protein, partial [Chloroflexi bacterium]|nr:ABC transporter substrate-binding protein [Chloroflexota bacterium]
MKNLRLLLLFALIVTLAVPVVTMAQGDDDEEEDEMPLIGFWEECEDSDALSDTVNVGVIFSLSGGASVYGATQQNGVMLAMEEINESGYLGEAELNLVIEDGGSDPDTAIAAMDKLVNEDEVVAVIGPTLSNQAFSADPIAQEAGIPVMGVSNTATGITEMGDFVFRNSLPESDVIPGNLAQAIEILGIESVGVMYSDDDDFSVSGYNVFVETLEELGVEVVGEETFQIGDTSFEAQLSNLVFEDIDALVVSTLAAEATLIVEQARALDFTGPIIGGNGFNTPAIAQNVGEAADGVIVGAAWHVTSPTDINTNFVEMYEEAFESSPDQFAA